METNQQEIYTPDSVIAAAVPYGKENPRDVAYNNAAYALDRDDVHMVYSVDGRHVYFIAAPSADFSGHPAAYTPLASSLPNMKDHQGDGAYVAISSSAYAVVVKKENDMFSYVGDKQSVDAFIASHGVPTINTMESSTVAWEGYHLGLTRIAAQISKMAAMAGMGVLMVAIMAWVFFALRTTNYEDVILQTRQQIQQSMKQAVSKLSDFSTHPLQKDLQDMQNLMNLSARAGGWVKKYEIDEKSGTAWTVQLPRWVTGEYLDQFGEGLEVQRSDETDFIIVEKQGKTTRRRKR